MRSLVFIIASVGVFCLLVTNPSFQAIEKQLVEEEQFTVINDLFYQNPFFYGSALKKIFGLLQLSLSIGISIYITQLLSLRVLPIVLEIGFGPVVFLLVMALLLTIPFQLINGTCLFLQKKFLLNNIQTKLLTMFSFLLFIIGNILMKFLIPSV
jgi:hypothetical protein